MSGSDGELRGIWGPLRDPAAASAGLCPLRARSAPPFPRWALPGVVWGCSALTPRSLRSFLPRLHARPLVRHHPQPPLGLGAGHPGLGHREAPVLGGAERPRGRAHPRHHGLVRRCPGNRGGCGRSWGGPAGADPTPFPPSTRQRKRCCSPARSACSPPWASTATSSPAPRTPSTPW